MRIIHRRCAGLDVHKKSISVCIRIRVQGDQVEVHERVFGTFTQDLEQLRDWLKQHRVKQVAMESTGVYWRPVWNILEPVRLGFELVLVNPQTVQALRGAKTDRIDAARIAEYLQHGLLRGSFVPPRAIRELRDLTRSRVHLQQDRNRLINRIGGLLETVNIKLGSVASNIVGKTGRAILDAILDGRTQPEKLADLAKGSLKEKKPELALALDGRFTDHFRWMLRQLVEEVEWLDRKLSEVDQRLELQTEPHADLVRRLSTIPGVSKIIAWALISELGTDMSVFPTADHAASWAGLCPGNSESAGKRMSGRTRKGNRYLRRILIQSCWAVTHKKDCFLTALFYRISSRRGMKKAALAVAHRILILAYYIIRDGVEYQEMGGSYFDLKNPERTVAKLSKRLENMGFQVEISGGPADAAGSTKRGRGRPCLCAIRGIECRHQGRKPDSGGPPVAALPEPSPQASPQAPGICPRCARWGIACIHARNKIPNANSSSTPTESKA